MPGATGAMDRRILEQTGKTEKKPDLCDTRQGHLPPEKGKTFYAERGP